MRELPYSIEPSVSPGAQQCIPPVIGDGDDPSGYRPDPGLVDAVNVALVLRQPLLVTGEPGTGKTQLAKSIAYQLGLGEPVAFETKSTSVARDLFYSFDHLARFRGAQTGTAAQRVADYLSFNALGYAIILANPPDRVRDYLPPGFTHPGARRSVVLIDEIDKAPRDFPNDILNEVERFFFRIPELGGQTISAPDALRPVLLMTSNSEKALPDAFLRRCIFYNIPFPDEARLDEIVLTRLAGRLTNGAALLRDSTQFFLELRSSEQKLRKRPGTAELLNWLGAMLEFGCDAAKPLKEQERTARATLPALSKVTEDQGTVRELFARWTAAPSDKG